jgi:hypothetical protein
MPRRKDAIKSDRVRWDGNRKRGVSERYDRVFAWNDANSGDKFGAVWELVASALAGELGAQVQEAVRSGDTVKTMAALQDVLGAFGGDDI